MKMKNISFLSIIIATTALVHSGCAYAMTAPVLMEAFKKKNGLKDKIEEKIDYLAQLQCIDKELYYKGEKWQQTQHNLNTMSYAKLQKINNTLEEDLNKAKEKNEKSTMLTYFSEIINDIQFKILAQNNSQKIIDKIQEEINHEKAWQKCTFMQEKTPTNKKIFQKAMEWYACYNSIAKKLNAKKLNSDYNSIIFLSLEKMYLLNTLLGLLNEHSNYLQIYAIYREDREDLLRDPFFKFVSMQEEELKNFTNLIQTLKKLSIKIDNDSLNILLAKNLLDTNSCQLLNETIAILEEKTQTSCLKISNDLIRNLLYMRPGKIQCFKNIALLPCSCTKNDEALTFLSAKLIESKHLYTRLEECLVVITQYSNLLNPHMLTKIIENIALCEMSQENSSDCKYYNKHLKEIIQNLESITKITPDLLCTIIKISIEDIQYYNDLFKKYKYLLNSYNIKISEKSALKLLQAQKKHLSIIMNSIQSKNISISLAKNISISLATYTAQEIIDAYNCIPQELIDCCGNTKCEIKQDNSIMPAAPISFAAKAIAASIAAGALAAKAFSIIKPKNLLSQSLLYGLFGSPFIVYTLNRIMNPIITTTTTLSNLKNNA